MKNAAGAWWPVRDPKTGARGYVRAGLLAPATPPAAGAPATPGDG